MNKTENNVKNFRSSKNMQMVIEILESAEFPVTADFIYQKLKNYNKSISLSTVYRILEKLSSGNILQKTVFKDDTMAKYELIRRGHRHYLICTKCNNMTPIKSCPLNEVEKCLENDTGFNIQGHKLEIYGKCANCK